MARCLDIGPGTRPAPGFETLDAHKAYNPTHVGDARKPPFPDNTFDIVHASHIIEHIEWGETQATLNEWARIVKPGGCLEVWTVNAIVCFNKILEWEATGELPPPSTWRANLTGGDPFLYWVGKLMNYDAKGKNGHLNLHRSIWTPRHLIRQMEAAGLVNITAMDVETETRGHKHKMINFGFRGFKPC
jgi:ubiquinone/menaquinone biosynthesis C-methylase UbiE